MTIRKIGIIGAGHVGSHVGFALATQGEVDQLLLIDSDYAKATAQALDIRDSVSYLPHHVELKVNDYDLLKEMDIVVICVGPPSGPSEDRLDELAEIISVLKQVLPKLQTSDFSGIIINISNPADVVTAYIQKYLDYPSHKILSTGCVLDSARLQSQLASMLGVNRRSLSAFCLGEHGFSAMIPWSHVTIAGQPVTEYEQCQHLLPFDRQEILQVTKEGGYAVLQGKGSTEFGIATSLVEVVRAIYHDEKKILPVSVKLAGQYNQQGVFASVPAIIGKTGVEHIIEWQLTAEESHEFDQSCQVIRENLLKIYNNV